MNSSNFELRQYQNNSNQVNKANLGRQNSQDPISTSIQSIRSESVFEEPEYVNQSNLSPKTIKSGLNDSEMK